MPGLRQRNTLTTETGKEGSLLQRVNTLLTPDFGNTDIASILTQSKKSSPATRPMAEAEGYLLTGRAPERSGTDLLFLLGAGHLGWGERGEDVPRPSSARSDNSIGEYWGENSLSI